MHERFRTPMRPWLESEPDPPDEPQTGSGGKSGRDEEIQPETEE